MDEYICVRMKAAFGVTVSIDDAMFNYFLQRFECCLTDVKQLSVSEFTRF